MCQCCDCDCDKCGDLKVTFLDVEEGEIFLLWIEPIPLRSAPVAWLITLGSTV